MNDEEPRCVTPSVDEERQEICHHPSATLGMTRSFLMAG